MRVDKRFFSLFLVVLLAVSVFAPFISAQDTKELDRFMLNVVVEGRNVLFVNEKVSLKVQSNVSDVLVEIFDSANMSVYSGFVEANSTFAWLPPVVYGLFTVKATVEKQVCTTWFWLQDTRSLSATPSTKSWSYNGLTCNLMVVTEASKVSTYSFQASKENAVFETEWLSEVFTKLKPTEYSVEANTAGCVRIKTYSAKNLIDSWVMNTWFGVKIRVNGTLEKAETFKWALKAASENVLWQIGGLRVPTGSGNLVYDWSDMDSRSTGVSYVLDKTELKLDVTLQSSFDLDPTIFSDGFESGNFSAWSGTDGSPAVNSGTKHHGIYSVYFADGNVDVYLIHSAYSGEFMRCYINFGSQPIGSAGDFIRLYQPSYDWLLTLRYAYSGGVYYFELYNARKSASIGTYTMTASLGTWYCTEIQFQTDTNGTNGVAKFWLNGTLRVSSTTVDFDTIQCVASEVGNTAGGGNKYVDCCVVADAYIGPETTNYTVPLSLASAMTYATSKQWQAKNTVALATGESYLFNGASNCKLTPNWATSESYTVAGQWQSKNALTLQTAESYTLSQQTNYKTTTALATPLMWALASQTSYQTTTSLLTPLIWVIGGQSSIASTLTWTTQTAFTLLPQSALKLSLPLAHTPAWLTMSETAYGLALPFAEGFTWLPSAKTNYNLALSITQSFSWLTSIVHTLREGIAYMLNLAWNTQQTWMMLTQTAYGLAVPFAQGFGWLINAQTSYNLALSLTQGYSWLLDILHIPHVITQIVDLVWNAPFAWTTHLQSAFNVALTWVSGQTWTLDLIKGLGYIVDLVWQTGFAWMLGLWPVEIAGGILGIAAFAFIIAIVALGVAAFVMLRRKEN